ncbi:MAG: hypothetical protein EPO24_11175 [Bacteroidetes bacterium]|nr:MAG: hypothetical protein EPO24_11175 [Bacteroidota bacterium]
MKSYFYIVALFFIGRVFLYSQFHVDTLATSPDIAFPVAIAFPPDSSHRMFFTEKNSGKVRIIRNDTLLAEPFVTVPVATSGEQGMLGITFHPEYPDSPYIFLFYTRSTDRANMVVKYMDEDNEGINPETLMTVTRLTSAVYHNGGNIHFGPDNKLYATFGDYAVTANSQDTNRTNPRGKIHRINDDGTIPEDNPVAGNSLFSYGHRNSFDFTFDELTGKMYASENGVSCNDEINLIVPWGNYGWPSDGNCTYSGNSKYKRPMYHWPTNVPAVTGIIIYRDTVFPELYGKMLVANYNYGTIDEFTLNETGDSIVSGPTTIFSHGSGLNDIEVGPDGYIYLTNGTYGGVSNLLRLTPVMQVPPVPVLVTPLDSATNEPVQLMFSWSPTDETKLYHLQISSDSLFTSLIVNDSTVTDTSMVVDSLEHDMLYYWRVRAINSVGGGEYSSIRTFRTVIEPPQTPLHEFPPNDSIWQEHAVTLRWHASPSSEFYGVQVSTDSLFSSPLIDSQSVVDTFFTIVALQNDTTYYWRIRASNIGGASEYSVAWSFLAYDTLTFIFNINERWNLISLPHITEENEKELLFPTAISDAFSYSKASGYIIEDSLEPTRGYWLRFDSAQNVIMRGEPLRYDTLDIAEGWNLIGSIADTVLVESIEILPPGNILSEYFYYEEGYLQADVLIPGRGYWVKAQGDGVLILGSFTGKHGIRNFKTKK